MKTSNRDLLVLVKSEDYNAHEMEAEVKKINTLLFSFETRENFCVSHELLDVNRHRVIDDRLRMLKYSRKTELKPFQFIFNKN